MIGAVIMTGAVAPLVAASYEGVIAPPFLYRRELFALDGEAALMPLPASALADLDVPADVERARELLGGA